MRCNHIMVILVDQRTEAAVKVQGILTKYGCMIRTRLGIHDTNCSESCVEEGLIILQLCGNGEDLAMFEQELRSISGVKVKSIDISFDE